MLWGNSSNFGSSRTLPPMPRCFGFGWMPDPMRSLLAGGRDQLRDDRHVFGMGEMANVNLAFVCLDCPSQLGILQILPPVAAGKFADRVE